MLQIKSNLTPKCDGKQVFRAEFGQKNAKESLYRDTGFLACNFSTMVRVPLVSILRPGIVGLYQPRT